MYSDLEFYLADSIWYLEAVMGGVYQPLCEPTDAERETHNGDSQPR